MAFNDQESRTDQIAWNLRHPKGSVLMQACAFPRKDGIQQKWVPESLPGSSLY